MIIIDLEGNLVIQYPLFLESDKDYLYFRKSINEDKFLDKFLLYRSSLGYERVFTKEMEFRSSSLSL